MWLSDISITRPVFASVISLLLIAFGLISFDRLSLREYPDIDPPVVSVNTTYRGAAASVVEARITQVIENRIAGVEGIQFIESSSQDGRSNINVEFYSGVDVDVAANDLRDRVSRVLNNLPTEADPPEVQKVDSSDDVIFWLTLGSDRMSMPELTDYAERYLEDRFSVLEGVARIRIGGGQSYAMRVWLDRTALAAHNLTAADVENALRAENVELPAGRIESSSRQFTVRVKRAFNKAEDFGRLVLVRGKNGYLVRLADVARVEKGAVETRTFFRSNGKPMVGVGIIKQSTANTISVARAARAEMAYLNQTLPEGMEIKDSYDSSIFIEAAIAEVYKTLLIAMALVILVIYLFLGSGRATLVPAITVPISLVATFMVLYALGFSINLFTLLALVLAIGLVVDDAIVVLENIHRRMEEYNEGPLVAAYRGTRQVGFAVVATTLVLVSVFVPIAFLQGDIGRLFSEFALTLATAVLFSGLVALTASPALASKIMRKSVRSNSLVSRIDRQFRRLQGRYCVWLQLALHRPIWIILGYVFLLVAAAVLFRLVPSEYAPKEDRGAFFVMINGPEGASFAFMEEYMNEIEARLAPLLNSGEVRRMLVRAPRSFGNIENFNSGMVINVLSDWHQRRSAWEIMDDVRGRLKDLPGVRTVPVMRQGIGSRSGKSVQFVIGGGTYEELAQWRDILIDKINADNPGLENLDWDYKETQPQIEVQIDYDRAADLGVTVSDIGRTLESLLGSRRVTTYIDSGEEYDVLVEGEHDMQRTPADLKNIFVRSQRTQQLVPLSSLVTLNEYAGSTSLNRYNRIRAITLEANLQPGYTLSESLAYLENLVHVHLPEYAIIDYKGESQDYKYSGSAMLFVFALGLLVVFLVLAAQFESYIHPLTIMLTVPLAVAGGLLGLWVTGSTLNLYSQIGLIMLIGLAAKNGILIVEFTNQLRDQGGAFVDALIEASIVRLRPILMTSITTAMGAVPLIVSFGAGAETRRVIGITVFSGVVAATLFTLFVVPVAYQLIARRTLSPDAVRRQLKQELDQSD